MCGYRGCNEGFEKWRDRKAHRELEGHVISEEEEKALDLKRKQEAARKRGELPVVQLEPLRENSKTKQKTTSQKNSKSAKGSSSMAKTGTTKRDRCKL